MAARAVNYMLHPGVMHVDEPPWHGAKVMEPALVEQNYELLRSNPLGHDMYISLLYHVLHFHLMTRAASNSSDYQQYPQVGVMAVTCTCCTGLNTVWGVSAQDAILPGRVLSCVRVISGIMWPVHGRS